MGKYTDPSGPTDTLIQMAVGLLVVMVALWIAFSIWAQIWMWVVAMVIVVGSIWLLVRWIIWRSDRW